MNENETPNNGIDDDGNGLIDDFIGYDFYNNDPFPYDDLGHGTMVSGLAASHFMGIAKKASILPIKAGSAHTMNPDAVLAGIDYAIEQKVDVLNISFHLKGPWIQNLSNDSQEKVLDPKFVAFEKAFQRLENAGIVVVVAAGNSGADLDQSSYQGLDKYPALFKNSNIITVAATNHNGVLSSYSNYGEKSVDIAAPGGSWQWPLIVTAAENQYENKKYPQGFTETYGTIFCRSHCCRIGGTDSFNTA